MVIQPALLAAVQVHSLGADTFTTLLVPVAGKDCEEGEIAYWQGWPSWVIWTSLSPTAIWVDRGE